MTIRRLFCLTTLALVVGQTLSFPVNASVLNTCRKKVTVSRVNASTVTVKVEAFDSSCIDPPFAGEFITLSNDPANYVEETHGVTDVTGLATISHTGLTVYARACATPQTAPNDIGENYYCEYSA